MNVVPTKQASQAGLWNVVKCLFSNEKPDASTLPTWFTNAALDAAKDDECAQESHLLQEWKDAHFNCGGCITGSEFTSNNDGT